MSSQSVSEGTFFQAKRSHCLSSSSVFVAGSLYVFSSKIIQMVSRGVDLTWVCRSVVFCYKVSKSFWHHVCMCAAFFSFKAFQPLLDIIIISSYSCARNFEIVKLNFFFTFLSCRIITHILTAFSITFLTHLNNNKKTAIHSLVCLLKSSLLTSCSLISFRFVQQLSNFCDWVARRP